MAVKTKKSLDRLRVAEAQMMKVQKKYEAMRTTLLPRGRRVWVVFSTGWWTGEVVAHCLPGEPSVAVKPDEKYISLLGPLVCDRGWITVDVSSLEVTERDLAYRLAEV